MCWSKPTKESISAFFFPSQVDKMSLTHTSLPAQSLIYMLAVSKSIPRKEVMVNGPSTFPSANGTHT